MNSDALDDDAIDDMTIGTIEYESTDGTVLAYEAGAVFREKGNETQVVSAPPIHYDLVTQTLTLPVVTATGDDRLGGGDVTFSKHETKTFQDANVVENESVEITIQSEYYRGWESFFRTEAGDTSVQSVDHDNQTLEVQVGYLDIEDAYEDGFLLAERPTDDDIHQNADIDEEDIETGAMPELDEIIDEIVDDIIDDVESGEEDAQSLSETDQTLTDTGSYWVDDDLEIASEDRLEFDISDGNSTVVVDGNVTVSGELIADAAETDHELKLYTTGNVHIDAGEVSVTDGNATNLQFYGTSDAHIGFGTGGTTYEGTLYAPRDSPWDGQENEVYPTECQAQVCMQSNVEVTGAIVARSLDAHSSSVTVEHDPALIDNEISLYSEEYELPPQLTYLNVAHHEIGVRNN